MVWLFKNKEKKEYTVTFATTCWENDWEKILKDPNYLKDNQISNNDFSFSEKIVIINNVKNLKEVVSYAKQLVDKNILTDYFIAQDLASDVLKFFNLKKCDFKAGEDANKYIGVDDNWVYFNAIGVMTAIYLCKTDYFLYFTGDSFLKEKVNWIKKSIDLMEKKKNFKVANLTWNGNYKEAMKESYKARKDFFISKNGFSDQCFLVRKDDFQKPIYNEIRDDANHFPRGDVFEKRVYSYMLNHGWKRITYRHGSYYHENI